jgi:hypothetical protein
MTASYPPLGTRNRGCAELRADAARVALLERRSPTWTRCAIRPPCLGRSRRRRRRGGFWMRRPRRCCGGSQKAMAKVRSPRVEPAATSACLQDRRRGSGRDHRLGRVRDADHRAFGEGASRRDVQTRFRIPPDRGVVFTTEDVPAERQGRPRGGWFQALRRDRQFCERGR